MTRQKIVLISILSIVVVVAILTVACARQNGSSSVTITAEVARVIRGKFPDVRLELRDVEYSKRTQLQGRIRDTLSVRPAYVSARNGSVVYTSAVTQRNLAAYYLAPGDRISARLLINRRSDNVYLITDVSRITHNGQSEQPRAMELKTDRDSYTKGQPVRMEFIIRNTTSKTVTYRFSSGQQYDFWAILDGREVWRWSHDKATIQVLTSFDLKPGESKTFKATWDQKDNSGRQVPPDSYIISGQLTTMRDRPAPVSKTIRILSEEFPSVEISKIKARPGDYEGKMVSISGVYYGWRAPEGIPGCDAGPPITRSDWIISDGKGCIYVTGLSEFDPVDDRGKSIVVVGEVKRNEKGQVYIEAESVRLED
ncbi:MAG: BsuPI-related putative proteinase inhibitor [Armatimonadota bacterium]|nr:BsuPI-related putative proteinase inhibitor [Armatimonadota bacterium]